MHIMPVLTVVSTPILCLSVFPQQGCDVVMGVVVCLFAWQNTCSIFSSLLCSQHLEQCLAHGRLSELRGRMCAQGAETTGVRRSQSGDTCSWCGRAQHLCVAAETADWVQWERTTGLADVKKRLEFILNVIEVIEDFGMFLVFLCF